MKRTRQKKVSNETLLGMLAFQFRGTRDETERSAITETYAQVVQQLIESKKWHEIPSLEDQLPDDRLPEALFDYWELR